MSYKYLMVCLLIGLSSIAQVKNQEIIQDSVKPQILEEIVVTASKKSESIFRSSVSIEQLKSAEVKNLGAPTAFDAMENIKGVQVITPSLGFKVINMRGFANTTNVRFSQLVDGVDNQAPHIGAPIANALGANDLDIDKIELIPGTASALYGMNAINGLANIRTKNPFEHQGIAIQQLSGVNHIGNIDDMSPQPYLQTNLRYAKAVSSKFAFKMNGSVTKAMDWTANNTTDLSPNLNASTGLVGQDNPAFDEVNSYGNESPNRKTLTLNGKKYVVARTGYREKDITDYGIKNYKGDVGLYFRPKKGHELSVTYKGALINTVYQRTNRFRLEDYTLGQYTLDYHSDIFQIRTYLTQENTGKSYNIRSLAENMDRAFKSDTNWFSDYTTQYNHAITAGESVADAHRTARQNADAGRYIPDTEIYNQKKNELTDINNWDVGAALRVKSKLFHSEGLLNWDKISPSFFKKIEIQVVSGFDYRTYIIVPDGNYFINPVDASKNLTYGKSGGFLQINKGLLKDKLKLSATLRADKADYFDWKFNPRFTAVYMVKEKISIRSSYQSGYRFPSIFEGFSNVNSGGVKRVGGLPVMSNGIFENSYTKTSIDAFQAQVNNDVNISGLTQAQAIDKNKNMLQKNPYTYMQPEYVRSFEFGVKGIILKDKLFFDVDFYYNAYDNFIAQVEANIPVTTSADAIPTALYDKTTQNRYRLWTNSKSKIYNYGSSLGLRYTFNPKYTLTGNCTYAKLDRTDNKDGLEDGFNTPNYIVNGTFITQNIWKNLGTSFTCRYQTKYNYVSSLATGEVPSFYALDGQVNYNFEKTSLLVKLGATNFTNKTYYNMLGGASVGALYYLSVTWMN